MSMNVMTTPRPAGRSIGTAVTETGNMVPSRRTNQSSARWTVTPDSRASSSGHSSGGYGEPSGRL